MTRLVLLLVAALALPLAACAPAVQREPEQVTVSPAPADVPRVRPGPAELRVYLVADGRLVPVRRAAAERDLGQAIALLVAGPTAEEAAAGIASALIPQQLTARPDPASPGTVVVDAGDDLARLAGRSQVTAVAQIVWTLTELPDVQHVRVHLAGLPIELPTDRGLTSAPVSRADYSTLAPP